MGKFDAYKIPLRGLDPGEHSFDVRLDRKFFTDIDGEEVQKGDLDVRIRVKKGTYSFEFAFSIVGRVWVPCDRCLDDVEIPVETEEHLTVKYGSDFSEEGDNIIVIPEDEDDFNVAWYLYEFVALAIPMKHVHAPGKCNKSMTSKLKKHSARSVDDESDEELGFDDVDESGAEAEQETVDPRWEGLKNLID